MRSTTELALTSEKNNIDVPLQKHNMSPSRKKKTDNTKPDMKGMRHVELKNIVDWFFLKSPPEAETEKTPIVQAFHDHGAIPKDPAMTADPKKGFFHASEEKSTTESGEEDAEKRPKMSILRKLCFLLSLNGGVLYVAAFLWFIPCRQQSCLQQQKDWKMNVSGQLTSSMESTPSTGDLSSVIFGYSNENGGNLASFMTSNGKMKWNKRTDHILRHVFCNYNNLDGKAEGIPKCVVTAYNYIAALDDSNGNLLWERNITNPDGETMHRIALARNSVAGFYIFGVSDAFLFVVDAKNGSQVTTVDLPCSWTLDVKLVGPLENNTGWILVCEYGDSVEVWTLEEKELFIPALEESTRKNNSSNQRKFSLLFSRAKSSIESIDLAGDVTRTPDSLVLSWANRVVMVTPQAPPRRPAWEVESWGTKGGSPTVTSILSGHFTNPNEIQIAVGVQDGPNATIHILERKNGTSLRSTNLGMRSVMSMEKIAGGNDETDMIVIESVHKINKKNADASESEALPSTRVYFTMEYSGGNVTYQNIASSDVFESILIPYSAGAASLLIASRNPEGGTTLSRHVVTSQLQETACLWGVHRNVTTVLLLD